jgi:hypothetical protein
MDKNIESLRNEFEKFVVEKCSTDDGSCETDINEDIPDEELPYFTDELSQKLLAPQYSGVNLSRVDLKRISDTLGDSVAIKDRKKMLKAILRHKQRGEELELLFNEIELHLNGRILIYREISENYPQSTEIFEDYIDKIERMKRIFKRIVDDFEDISPDSQPINFDDI